MILEWLEYFKTRGTQTAKEWGYIYQNVSLKFRARRCAAAWKSHNENCHQLIREHMQKVQPKSVMVIGSGLLLEVPMEDLLASAEQIYLVDLVHAPEVRKMAAKHPKITLIDKDISGLLGVLKKNAGILELRTIPWRQLPDWNMPVVDLVISANLLSQIPLMISEIISMNSDTYADFAQSVRDQHVERLLNQGKSVLLFADFETRYIDRDGDLLKLESYDVYLRSLQAGREWLWEISPYGEVSRNYKIEMLVKSYWKF